MNRIDIVKLAKNVHLARSGEGGAGYNVFAERLAQPRFLETLLFLQQQCGGLRQMIRELIQTYPKAFKGHKPPWSHEDAFHCGVPAPGDSAEATEGGLEGYFIGLCHDPTRWEYAKAPWYCPEIFTVLLDYMDRRAKRTARELAETEVTRTVFRELDFALSQNVPVPIVGASRFGKTTAVRVWAEMRPGVARLVTVPESNREADFFVAQADALGIDHHLGATTSSLLRMKVEVVLRVTGLFLVYDEAHFLVPVNYHKGTPPRRLNWIRSHIIDRGMGCAFFATPQSYRETLAAYVKKTGYNMEQWLGRLAPAVVLPESLAKEDVLAVVRKHFAGVPEPFLKLVAARAMQSEGYLKNAELCLKRSLFLAGERGRTKPDLADVQEALDYIMPGAATTAAPATMPRPATVRALPLSRTPRAGVMQRARQPEFSRREPSVRTGEMEPALAG
jgi:hypothetical protein